jgi:hypothetical protein
MYIDEDVIFQKPIFHFEYLQCCFLLKNLYNSRAAIIIIIIIIINIIIIESRNFKFLKYGLKQNFNNIIIPPSLMKIIKFFQNL